MEGPRGNAKAAGEALTISFQRRLAFGGARLERERRRQRQMKGSNTEM